MRRLAPALALASVVAVAGIRAGAGHDGVPLVLIPQGVSVLAIADERVFVVREGTLTLSVFSQRSPEGDRLVWCPRERFFVSPNRGELFDIEGRWVDGPARADMTRVAFVIDEGQLVRIDPRALRRASSRSKGEVDGASYEFYRRWSADLDRAIGFCADPVR